MKRRALVLLALVVLIIAGFAYLAMPKDVAAKMIAIDTAKMEARFSPKNSVDVAMAMKMVTHDPPMMLNPPGPIPLQLVFPPSAETLAKLSGP